MAQRGSVSGARAARPQPQTTGEPPGGTFEQHSRKSARPGYSVNSNYGQSIDQPLSAAPGYLRYLDLTLVAQGGVASSASTAAAANGAGTDFLLNGLSTANTTPVALGTATTNPQITTSASSQGNSPAAVVSFIQVKDAYGTPLFSGGGYEMLYLVPMFSGVVGVGMAADVNKWPEQSIGQLATGSTTTGNFFFHSRIPFEIVPGYGCLAIGNSSLQPSLHIQLQTSGALYSVAPATLPTSIRVDVDENYWAVPVDNPQLEPFGLGTTQQWVQVTANPTVGSATSQRVQFPRTGGYLTTLILVARDASGNRQTNVWPSRYGNQRIRLYLDGVPVLDESIDERIDKMYEEFGGLMGTPNTPPTGGVGAFPAGVIAYSFKSSESQMNLGHLDNGDLWMSSTPGTLIEVECTPWGGFASGPATITAIIGQIVPRGPVPQGLQSLA